MDFIPVVIFVVGVVVGYFIFKLLTKNSKDENSEDFALKEAEFIEKQKNLEQVTQRKIELETENKILKERIENSITTFKEQESKGSIALKEKEELIRELSSANTRIENLELKLNKDKDELEALQIKMQNEFKLIANNILKENSEQFSTAHKKELSEILNPLKEKIGSFEESVEKKYVDETKERSALKKELQQLMELNQTLNSQAKNLTNALKGENKTQGNWGELVLETILESSGLIKEEEYFTQWSTTNVDNKRIIPDVVVKLPEDKHIIIDAKVSLVAYERFVSSEIEEEQKIELKKHVESVKSHVKILSDKNYPTGIGINSPDFVLLFIPIESSFSLALQADRDLFLYAWDKKVVIVSPTTLLATIRTISSIWKNEKQTKNAIEIADRAGAMYDKFVAFVEDLSKVGRSLDQGQRSYDEAINKLKTGKGNLIRRAEVIKTLGAKAQKSIPTNLIEESEE